MAAALFPSAMAIGKNPYAVPDEAIALEITAASTNTHTTIGENSVFWLSDSGGTANPGTLYVIVLYEHENKRVDMKDGLPEAEFNGVAPSGYVDYPDDSKMLIIFEGATVNFNGDNHIIVSMGDHNPGHSIGDTGFMLAPMPTPTPTPEPPTPTPEPPTPTPEPPTPTPTPYPGPYVIHVTKNVYVGGVLAEPDPANVFTVFIDEVLPSGDLVRKGELEVAQGGVADFTAGPGTYAVSEDVPDGDDFIDYEIAEQGAGGGLPPGHVAEVTLGGDELHAYITVDNYFLAQAGPDENNIDITIEYYLGGVIDNVETNRGPWKSDVAGMWLVPGDFMETYCPPDKYPFYVLDYVTVNGVAHAAMPEWLLDGDVVRVYYRLADGFAGECTINLYKLLLDEKGQAVPHAGDGSDMKFLIVIDGPAANGDVFRAVVEVEGNAGGPVKVAVPRGIYAVAEDMAGLAGRYMMREIVISGNMPLLGNEAFSTIYFGASGPSSANATVCDVRIGDGSGGGGGSGGGDTNDDPDIPWDQVVVNKYVFVDGVVQSASDAQFAAVLAGAGGTAYPAKALELKPGTPTVFDGLMPGTYDVTENPPPEGYYVIGIYDANVSHKMPGAYAKNHATVEIERRVGGKAVAIFNEYIEPTPEPTPTPTQEPTPTPTPTPPVTEGGGGGGGSGGGGGGAAASPTPTPTRAPTPTPTTATARPTPTPSPTPVDIEDDGAPGGAAIPPGFIDDHIQYINGDPEGSVRPDDNVTRGEAAAIFFRLMSDPNKSDPLASTFSDITDDEWYAQSVRYLASKGIINGYPDGTFRGGEPITRPELATLISGFDQLEPSDQNMFSDIADHWAVGYINSAALKGWFSGYPDGTFRPEGYLTRAEIVTVINRMLHRRIELADIPSWAPSYNDISMDHWSYTNIIESSVGHAYDRKPNDYEIWTSKLSWEAVLAS